jgi:hypothetical protein
MIELILVLISLFLFAVYNAVSLKQFGIPKSLSETFYLWNSKKSGLGYIFTGMMFSMAFTLVPAWLELGEVISSWSTYLNPLVFFACAAIAFVGAAPAFRSCPLESKVHTTAAMTAAVCAVTWCLVTCWQIMYVPLLTAGVVAVIGWLTKSWKKASVYWLEMMAFGATFVTVIVELLMHL